MGNITKIKLPNNITYDIKDARINGVDTTPTSDSTNVVTSGGIKTAIDNAQVFVAGTGTRSAVLKGSGGTASGNYSVAEGRNGTATGNYSHAEGDATTANKAYSHAEGNQTIADASAAHAEGYKSESGGSYTSNTKTPGTQTANGSYAHSEGNVTIAQGVNSHSEGKQTFAQGTTSHAEGEKTEAKGNISHAEGYKTAAKGMSSHTEGYNTETGSNLNANTKEAGTSTAYGDYSHAEGNSTITVGPSSHAEGRRTISIGQASHAEGVNTVAGSGTRPSALAYSNAGWFSHAEGNATMSSGNSSHAEGRHTVSSGAYSHAEGYETTSSGEASHAEGNNTTSSGTNAHSEGSGTHAGGDQSHAEGTQTTATGNQSHAEGYKTVSFGQFSHVEGRGGLVISGFTFSGSANDTSYTTSSAHGLIAGMVVKFRDVYATIVNVPSTTSFTTDVTLSTTAVSSSSDLYISSGASVGQISHAEGDGTLASGLASHSEGEMTKASGEASHSEGYNTTASGIYSHAEGGGTVASNQAAHAEGVNSHATAACSHAEGYNTEATGDCSHAEGSTTHATEVQAHAEGYLTTASGSRSHAEGEGTTASGSDSHAEGKNTTAKASKSHAEGEDSYTNGSISHAEGWGTRTNNKAEHAEGSYNSSTNGGTAAQNTRHSVGIGTSDNDRKNAFEIMQNGDVYVKGIGGYNGTNAGQNGVEPLQTTGDFARPDGWYDGMTVGLAENLIDTKGAGTPQLIGPLRTACGNESITDEGFAVLKEVRGRSLIWNQLIKNGNFANGMTDWTVNNEEHATVSVSGGVLSGSWDGTGGNGFRQSLGEWAVGHKYYIAVTIKNALAENARYIYIGQLSSASLEERFQPGETRRVHGVITPTSRFPGTFSVNTNSNSTFAIEMSNVVIVDLTQMFGAGNEPTADVFRQMFSRPYYQTNAGTLVNVKASGYKTVGFNQWDEELEVGSINWVDGSNLKGADNSRSKNYIPVCAGMQYYINAVVYRYYYDANKNYLPSFYDNSGAHLFTIPSGAAYLRFRQTTSELPSKICINLSWSGYRNGEYEPYKTATLDINAIDKTATDGNGNALTPFPSGVNGIGEVSDTYDQTGGVVRFGVRAYQSGDESDATVMTDLTNTVYPLDNPVPFTWDEPFKTFITPIEDFGTEEMLPNGIGVDGTPLTAPMTAVIRYSTDFTREVANLPKNYISAKSLQNFIAELINVGVLASGSTMYYDADTGEFDFSFLT